MFPKGHGISPTYDPLLDSNDASLDTTASKETALAQFAAEMGVHPESDALLAGCKTKITDQDELEAHSKRKSDGKVLHPEGERISYILGKFGLNVINTGIVVDKEEKEAPTAEVAAEAE